MMHRLGWLLFAVTCALSALQVALLAAADGSMMTYDIIVEEGFPLVTLGSIAGAAVGAVIVARYPRNLIGWLFCFGQLGNAIGLAGSAYLFALANGFAGALPAALVRYPAQIFNATYTMAFLALIFLLAPDGHLPSRRWRLAPVVPVAAVVLQAVVIIGIPSSDFEPGATPVYGWHTILLIIAADIALAISIALGAAALWRRLRVARDERRQQLRWLAAAAAALTGTYIAVIPAQILFAPAPWWVISAWHVSYLFVSIAVGVAILRYRLYDIDVILSRAIALSVLGLFVTVGYVLVVVTVGALLTAVGSSGELYWPSLVATGLVAVAFQPVRRHVLTLADQLVYGNRAAPYEALASLSRRLAESPSPEALPARVAEATGRSVGAAGVQVRLGDPNGAPPVSSATWSDNGSSMRAGLTAQTFPVADLGDEVGSIEVTMPPGRALRIVERRLVEDVAGQAGVAFRNALLEAELAERVTQGKAQSANLAASRRRLLDVEDDARERLAGAIRRTVVPHLAAVDAGLRKVSDPTMPVALAPLIAETECALEELRTVCRGVFPALLERRGLGPALTAALDASHPHATLQIDESAQRRLDPAAEAAGYLFCIEVAPTDRRSVIELRATDDLLLVRVTGELLAGGPENAAGLTEQPAWQHIWDRVNALDGDISIERRPLRDHITARIPLGVPGTAAPVASRRSTAEATTTSGGAL
ncbi:MAG: hypothetical protein ABWZ98_12650 [Nakamurella sp.]